MPRISRRRISTAVLALSALCSLAFAPAVDIEPQSQAGQDRSCLEGYAYVTANGSNVGPTSPVCVLRTDCGGFIGSGPTTIDGEAVELHYYVSVPRPAGVDVACYL